MTIATPTRLRALLGDVDIYLVDQILRGRLTTDDVVLDAGCGFGRNLVPLLRLGIRVLAADADADAIRGVRELAASAAPDAALDARAEAVESLSFPDRAASFVISSAVLHFARDEAQFLSMIRSMWRCTAPGGIVFARLATSIGAEHVGAARIDGRRFRLGDGTTRFLADQAWLLEITAALGGQLADPLKTTIVQDQRCMTTWVMRKPRGAEAQGATR